MTKRILALPLLGAAFAVLAAASAPIDAGKSKITANFTQMKANVSADFKTFSGSIAYDPAHAAASSAEITVDTGSIDLGSDEYTDEVRKKEWFDTATFKTATFKSTSIKSLGPDRFEAEGPLTLKGISKNVKATVSVKTEGATRRFEGQLPVSRAAYKIGDAEWNEVLDDAVVVKFVIVAPAS